jgi:hypothetical protein
MALGLLGSDPFIVSSRASPELLNNLLANPAPILFEGLHCCYFLDDLQLDARTKAVRTHNVEWAYYKSLGQIERRFFREIYFRVESARLKRFERKLNKAQWVFPISKTDTEYYQDLLADNQSVQVSHSPAFHAHREIVPQKGRGDFALYHGNLSVGENVQAATFLIEQVFSRLDIPFKIAGLDPDYKLYELARAYPHMEIIASPNEEQMQNLIRQAQLHVLPTFQQTGIKLKLLQVLYSGRQVLVNPQMLEGSGLDHAVEIADGAEEFQKKIRELWEKHIQEEDLIKRRKALSLYDTQHNALDLIQKIYS